MCTVQGNEMKIFDLGMFSQRGSRALSRRILFALSNGYEKIASFFSAQRDIFQGRTRRYRAVHILPPARTPVLAHRRASLSSSCSSCSSSRRRSQLLVSPHTPPFPRALALSLPHSPLLPEKSCMAVLFKHPPPSSPPPFPFPSPLPNHCAPWPSRLEPTQSPLCPTCPT